MTIMMFSASSLSLSSSSSSIRDLRENASKLNNQGLLFLREGDFIRARQCFHGTLSLLKLFARAEASSVPQETSSHLLQADRPIRAKPSSSRSLPFLPGIPKAGIVKKDETRTFASSTDLLQMTTESFHGAQVSSFKDTTSSSRPVSAFLHSEAIPIPLPEEGEDLGIGSMLDPNLVERVCSAICIFNLALIHHLQGIGETSCQQCGNTHNTPGYRMKMLQVAHSLYEKCKCLLFGHGFHGCLATHPTADLVAMAVLNNQALINYYEQYDFKQANQNTKCLLHVASMIQPYGYGHEQIARILVQAQNKFVLNALVLLKTPATAHAA